MIRANTISQERMQDWLKSEHTIAYHVTNDLPEDMWLAKELCYYPGNHLYKLIIYSKNSKSLTVAESQTYDAMVNEYNSLDLLEFYRENLSKT
jgi:hypothetical protein